MLGVPVLNDNTRISKDASEDFKITYKWSGNNPQQTGNEITVYNNETNDVVYNVTSTNFYKQECTIPANALTNGRLYRITIRVICNEGISLASEPILFYCYTTPVLSFRNLIPNQIIENDSFQVELSYQQLEGEELENFYIGLYASNQNEIYKTSVRYDTTNLTLTIPGLENNTQYFLKAYGTTITGMEIETASVPVIVRYLEPTLYSLIELDNNCQGGYTTIKSNIVSLRARIYRNGAEIDPSYINGEFVDLRMDTDVLKFAENFVIPDNFTLELKGYGFKRNTAPLIITNGKYRISVYYRIGSYDSANGIDMAYFEVRVENEMAYVIYSNYVEVATDNRLIGFMLTRKSNIYDIQAHDYGEVVNES